MKFKILNLLIIIALLVILFNLFFSCKEGLTNNDSNSDDTLKKKKKDKTFPGGTITHYWDCCKESCAWSDAAAQVNACDPSGKSPSMQGDYQKSICKPDHGSSTTCAGPRGKGLASRYPWVENGILYGYVAGPNRGANPKAACGSCYEIELENAGKGIEKAIVQWTSLGNVNGIFDFAVPGGGFGDYNGCSQMDGWNVYGANGGGCDPDKDTDQCTRYGGFHDLDQCSKAFYGDPDAKKACREVLFGVFPKNAPGVPFRGNLQAKSFKSIECPSKLTGVTGASAPPFTPPPPPTPEQACNYDCGDCGWANPSSCSTTDRTHAGKCGSDVCYTTCCKKLGIDCVDFCNTPDHKEKPGKYQGGGSSSSPSSSGDGCDCSWTNGGANCGTDDGSNCWSKCCGSSSSSSSSGNQPSGNQPSGNQPSGDGKGLCKWPNCDGSPGGDWCNTEANCSVCGGSWCTHKS